MRIYSIHFNSSDYNLINRRIIQNEISGEFIKQFFFKLCNILTASAFYRVKYAFCPWSPN